MHKLVDMSNGNKKRKKKVRETKNRERQKVDLPMAGDAKPPTLSTWDDVRISNFSLFTDL